MPQTWDDLLETPRRYLFALGSSNSVSDAVLAHYLSAGGRLTDDQGNPVLDEIALRTLLETYQKARDAGVLPGNFVELDNADKVWNAWRGLGTAVANLNATRYLSVETRLPDLQVGDLPALIQPARSVGRGWAYAIVTKDPRRQAAAARLLQHLLSPQNNGEWTRAAGVLPGRAAALAQWDQADPYTTLRQAINWPGRRRCRQPRSGMPSVPSCAKPLKTCWPIAPRPPRRPAPPWRQ